MPLNRLLVVLWELPDARAAADTLRRALEQAGSPGSLRFALPRRLERAFRECWAQGAAPESADVRFYGDRSGLSGVAALLTDETHFLALTGPYDFEAKWDQTLLNRFSRIPERDALMTGRIGEATGECAPQPYLPALARDFQGDEVLLKRGLPLVCSAAPVKTLVADPALLFGKANCLSKMDMRRDTLSIAAYAGGIPLYALDRAALWPTAPLPEIRLRRPTGDALPATVLARFEQLAGFRYEQRKAGVRTTWGLFTPEDTYRQQLPGRLAVAQRAKALLRRPPKKNMPLLATAFIDLPSPRRPIPVYMIRFGFLKALESLSLYLYTGGAQERLLRAGFPNAHSYPDNNLLPKSLMDKGMPREQWMRRCKFQLLKKTADQHPDFTHVAWVNLDVLKHPVCPQALPDFSEMMDDRVHLATVDGVPDLSFFVVPIRALGFLCRETRDLSLLDVQAGKDYDEEGLLTRLYGMRPSLFAFHPMPKKHLLFLTAFDPSLLDERAKKLLGEREPVLRPDIEKKKELTL